MLGLVGFLLRGQPGEGIGETAAEVEFDDCSKGRVASTWLGLRPDREYHRLR
jgi:hypothetical protein